MSGNYRMAKLKKQTHKLAEHIRALMLPYHGRVWIALSGGLDSTVLCHAVANALPCDRIKAVYINHHLQADADNWSAHCATFCAQLGISFQSIDLDTKPQKGESIEAWARQSRYAVFAELLDTHDVLLTAHHQNDQAETLLLQLMRGAGPKGLSSMPVSKAFGKGQHLRPLLSVSRDDLELYAKTHGLPWVNDPSNESVDYDRNFIRHEILPALEKRWPQAVRALGQSAERCADQQALIDQWAQETLPEYTHEQPHCLNIAKLLRLSFQERAALIRFWCAALKLRTPGERVLNILERDLMLAREDANPVVAYEGGEFRRYRQGLYWLDKPAGNRKQSLQGKDSKLFKKHCQKQGIPPWERDSLISDMRDSS